MNDPIYFRSGAMITKGDLADINGHLHRVQRVVKGYAEFVLIAGEHGYINGYNFSELEEMQRKGTFKLYTYHAIC